MPLGVAPTPLSPPFSLSICPFLDAICCLFLSSSSLQLPLLLIKSRHCLDDFYCLVDPIPGPPLNVPTADIFLSVSQREMCVCVLSIQASFVACVSSHNGTAIKIYMKNSPNYENAIKVMQVNDSIAQHKDPRIPRERGKASEPVCVPLRNYFNMHFSALPKAN